VKISNAVLILAMAVSATSRGETLPNALSAADHVARGDRAHRARRAAAALEDYEAALLLEGEGPGAGEALAKAARESIFVGESEVAPCARQARFRQAEAYARRAVAATPASAEAHFQLAFALGEVALDLGPRDQVKYATAIRAEAERALQLDPRHSGALHVMGRWNAEVMRLNRVSRLVAEHLLGGAALSTASWDEAQSYLEQAVAIDPERMAHRLDLAMVYADRDMVPEARTQLEWIQTAPLVEFNDPLVREKAALALAQLP
jgi:tetratricopeptide (TPR) repeat protein